MIISFQTILSKKLVCESDKYEVIKYPEDDEIRVYCDICDKPCIEQFYENHPKSGTHTNNNRKRPRSKQMISNNLAQSNTYCPRVICDKLIRYEIKDKHFECNYNFFEQLTVKRHIV